MNSFSRGLALALATLTLVLTSLPSAFAGGQTEETDTGYLAWVREELGTNGGGAGWEGPPAQHVLVYPGETLDHQQELEEALEGTRFLLVVLPAEMAQRVYPRIFAGEILLREYQFDGVAVLAGQEGGFESRFGWTRCHEAIGAAGVAERGTSTLNAVPALRRCLSEAAPSGWEAMRRKLIAGERQDPERVKGLFVSKYDGPIGGEVIEPGPAESGTSHLWLMGLAAGLLIGGGAGVALGRLVRPAAKD